MAEASLTIPCRIAECRTLDTIVRLLFEFGFSDSILQMWAAFLHELAHGGPLKEFAGCVTPAETALSHRLFTAALESQRQGTTVAIGEG